MRTYLQFGAIGITLMLAPTTASAQFKGLFKEIGKAANSITSSSKEPISHTVYDANLTLSAGSRPFVADTSKCAPKGEVVNLTLCRSSMERAMVERGYRIAPDAYGLTDYNLLQCELIKVDTRSASGQVDEIRLGALTKGKLKTKKVNKNYVVVDSTTSCTVRDGVSGRAFYAGLGAASTKREITQMNVPNEYDLVGDGFYKSILQSVGKLGDAARGTQKETITVTAMGTDDGNMETRQRDYNQALINAKSNVVEQIPNRVIVAQNQAISTSDMSINSSTKSYSDNYFKDLKIRDLGYSEDGIYMLEVTATIELSGAK